MSSSISSIAFRHQSGTIGPDVMSSLIAATHVAVDQIWQETFGAAPRPINVYCPPQSTDDVTVRAVYADFPPQITAKLDDMLNAVMKEFFTDLPFTAGPWEQPKLHAVESAAAA